MRLKSDLKKKIEGYIQDHRDKIDSLGRALQTLGTTNFRKATYIINLNSAWACDGEKSTFTLHTGTLEDAIKTAESEFKSLNQRRDIQATYLVSIRLGQEDFSLPEEYWKQYTQRYRK